MEALTSEQDSAASPLIIDIPPKVLEELCNCMDCLSDWEWMRFASRLINNQTELRRIRHMEKMGISVTRELLWYWGQRMATVQGLGTVLQDLELYRAMDILEQWSRLSGRVSSVPEDRREGTFPARLQDSNLSEMQPPHYSIPESPVHRHPPPAPLSLLNSLQDQSDLHLISCSEEALCIPQQECNLFVSSSCQLWTREKVEGATERFSNARAVHRGEFADVFRGQDSSGEYAIKILKKAGSEQHNTSQSFFYTEAQIGFRCNHSNLLMLSGFCVEDGCHCLIYPFMANGSVDVALQRTGTRVLSWERRLGIARGLLQAVRHLHEAGIFHGNIKSSNVLLDQDFSPRLGHSGLRCCPDKSASYRQAKTRDLQKFQPYLPDRFLRSGQLDGQTDIFSLGVILAELFTGLKSSDAGRAPVYLKDLILEVLERERGQVQTNGDQSGEESAECRCAKQLTMQYQDERLCRLPEEAAFYFASAVCLCLTKKKAQILEVCAKMEQAERHFRDSLERRFRSQSSVNVPEESDYDGSECSSYTVRENIDLYRGVSEPPTSKDCQSPNTWYAEAASANPSCDLGAAGRVQRVQRDQQSDSKPRLTASSDQQETEKRNRTLNLQEQNRPSQNCDVSSSSAANSDTPSWGIEVNEKKRQLMMNIALYEDERLDSSELFDSY